MRIQSAMVLLGAIAFLVPGSPNTSQAAHDLYGSGPIKLSPAAQAGLEEHLADRRSMYFAVSVDGKAWGASVCTSTVSASYCIDAGSARIAIRACEKASNGVPCKIYAKRKKIVWKDASITSLPSPDAEESTEEVYVNWAGEGQMVPKKYVGAGSIELTPTIRKGINEYRAHSHPQYLAISENGKSYGYFYCDAGFDNCERPIAALLVAIKQCESTSDGSPCRILARKRTVVWAGAPQIDLTATTAVRFFEDVKGSSSARGVRAPARSRSLRGGPGAPAAGS